MRTSAFNIGRKMRTYYIDASNRHVFLKVNDVSLQPQQINEEPREIYYWCCARDA